MYAEAERQVVAARLYDEIPHDRQDLVYSSAQQVLPALIAVRPTRRPTAPTLPPPPARRTRPA